MSETKRTLHKWLCLKCGLVNDYDNDGGNCNSCKRPFYLQGAKLHFDNEGKVKEWVDFMKSQGCEIWLEEENDKMPKVQK